MNQQSQAYDDVVELVMGLSRTERARLIAQIAPTLVEEKAGTVPKRSSYGILADLDIDLSAEAIDEVRREMWADFPRKDVFLDLSPDHH